MPIENTSAHEDISVIQYPDLSTMDDDTLRSLVDKEREWWGYEGFGEYLICSNEACRAIQSIEEVYGVSQKNYVALAELEKDGPQKPPCPCCQSPTELLLDPEFYFKYNRDAFKDGSAFGTVVVNQNKEILGMNNAFHGSVHDLLASVINYRNGYDVEACAARIADVLGVPLDQLPDAVCYNKTALDRSLRGTSTFSSMTQTLFDMHPEYDPLPILTDTRFDTNVYPIYKAQGWHEIATDTFGHVLFVLDSYEKMKQLVALSRSEFRAQFGNGIREVRREQAAMNTDLLKQRKHYRDVKSVEKHLNESSQSTETQDGFTVENVTSREITPEIVGEIADFFRYMFCNAFGQYIFYPSEGVAISPKEAFGTSDKTYIPLDQLDAFDLDAFPRHPATGERAEFWHHPDVTRDIFLRKLGSHAHISIVRGSDGNIEGVCFGHKCTLRDAFETEEWENPQLYSGIPSQNMRSFDVFKEKISTAIRDNEELGLSADISDEDMVYVWNTVACSPRARGYSRKLMSGLRDLVEQEEKNDLLEIYEAQHGSIADRMFRRAGGIYVPGFLQDEDVQKGDSILSITRIKPFLHRLTSRA